MIEMNREDIPEHLLEYFEPGRTYKPKDDAMIPGRVYDALMADGWYGRSKIVWAKGNPMPESVTDRPTKSHEYILLLSKNKRYFYDHEAIKEPTTRDWLNDGSCSHYHEGNAQQQNRPLGSKSGKEFNGKNSDPSKRNKWTVWNVNTKPFPGAHFAVFPPSLVEPCILAGTSEKGACRECLAPYERVVEKERSGSYEAGLDGEKTMLRNDTAKRNGRIGEVRASTKGWQPTCDCEATGPIPCTVLDPFGGAGTTALTALAKGRDAVLIELNPDYAEMAAERVRGDAPMFNRVEIKSHRAHA